MSHLVKESSSIHAWISKLQKISWILQICQKNDLFFSFKHKHNRKANKRLAIAIYLESEIIMTNADVIATQTSIMYIVIFLYQPIPEKSTKQFQKTFCNTMMNIIKEMHKTYIRVIKW